MQSDRRYCVRHKLFNIHNMAVGFMFIVLMIVCEINGAAIIKRDTTPGYNLESVENNGDKSNVNYDEYPVSLLDISLNFCWIFYQILPSYSIF